MTQRCLSQHSLTFASAPGRAVGRMALLQCERPASHVGEDAERKWPEGEGVPRSPTRKKGGFMLTEFPVGAPIHVDETGARWTDPEWFKEPPSA